MAKSSKKKNLNEPISVSEIYETIQARDFLRELWWDLISDIQEKPTYKRIKAMVTDVINNAMNSLTTKSVDNHEEMKRRTALTEISIMTYTLDTVISEVLYRRYQNEFEDIVKKLIKDLLKDNTKEDSCPVETGSVFENIENIFGEEKYKVLKEKDPANSNAGKPRVQNSDKDLGKSKEVAVQKRGRPRKINMGEKKAENVNDLPKKKRGRPPAVLKKNTDSSSFSNKMKMKENLDSDAESELSIGNLSIDSVSSVHTSELSSFEDNVSICSDEEGQKKHVPLKVANEMYLQGKLSQIYQFGKRSEKFKLNKQSASSSFMESSKANNSSSANVHSSSRKVLPQRIRKPNSKYSSETMYCGVKDYSSPPADTGSSSSQDEMDNKSPVSPKFKRRLKRSSLDKETASKSPSRQNVSSARTPAKRIKTNNSPLSKASTKRYDTSDLYKPRAVMGSSLGSKSTAFTA